MYFWISAFDHRAIIVPKMHIVHCCRVELGVQWGVENTRLRSLLTSRGTREATTQCNAVKNIQHRSIKALYSNPTLQIHFFCKCNIWWGHKTFQVSFPCFLYHVFRLSESCTSCLRKLPLGPSGCMTRFEAPVAPESTVCPQQTILITSPPSSGRYSPSVGNVGDIRHW